MDMRKIKRKIDKLDKRMNNLYAEAYLMYFFDEKHYEIYEIVHLKAIITHEKTAEKFLLEKPAFYQQDIPVFVVQRGYPLSLNFEFKKKEFIEPEKLKLLDRKEIHSEKIFIEKGCSSFEVESKLDSLYTQSLFNKRELDKRYYLLSFAGIIIAVLLTIVVMLVIAPTKTITNTEYIYIPYPELFNSFKSLIIGGIPFV